MGWIAGFEDESKKCELLGRLSVGVAAVVMGKVDSKDDRTIENIANQFAEELKIAYKSTIVNPWQQHAPEKVEVDSQAQSSSSGVVQFTEQGKVHNPALAKLKVAGLVKGTRLRKSSSSEIVEVVEIQGNGKVMCMAVQEDGTLSKSSRSLSAAAALKCEVVKHRKVVIENLASKAPWCSVGYRESICKSIISATLSSIMMQTTHAAALSVVTKPIRAVVAEDSFKKGELVLAFESTRISITDIASPAKKDLSFDIDIPDRFDLPNKKVVVQAMASESGPMISPSWFVRLSKIDEASNMTMKFHEASYRLSSPDAAIEDRIDMLVPYLVNTKAIAPGDELVIDKWKQQSSGTKRPAIGKPESNKKARS